MGNRPRCLVLGGGRLALAWVTELQPLGYDVHLHSRRPPSGPCPSTHSVGTMADAPLEGRTLVLMAVTDDALEELAEVLVSHPARRAEHIFLHSSGLCNSTVIQALKAAGSHTGSLHPLQSFSLPSTVGKMSGIFFAVEGDEVANEEAQKLATAVGGRSKIIAAHQKVAYHASAVIASNLLIALADAAVETAQLGGFSHKEAMEMLLPLIAGSVENLQSIGLPGSLTGPISRGDSKVVEKHLLSLKESPALIDVYRTLSRRAVLVAKKQGTAMPEQLGEIREHLEKI